MNDVTPSGVPGVGEVPWGSHFCHFYSTREDLVDTLVPYFKSGLDSNEACLWVTSEPFSATDARAALGAVVPDLAERERRGQIDIIDHREWYLRANKTDARSVLEGWVERQTAALREGYRGLRLTGNTHWLRRDDWSEFVEYEALVNQAFRSCRIVALCSYCFERCTAQDVLDVVKNHQFAVARRQGNWEVIESSALRMAREDLLRLQQAERALRETDRRKDEFLAMLGHELRNPLAPMLTALELMRLRGGAQTFRKETEVLERQVQHLVGLVDDLLDVSRITRGKIELRCQKVEIGEVVGRAIEMASPLLEQRKHSLTVDVPAQGLAVNGDPVRLAQIVSNLLNNAAKYTDPGGSVAVIATTDGEAITLRVRDSGAGIPPDLLPRIFELFIQGARTFDRAQGGLGLGLPIVKNLVELHGGTVEVRSTLGKGSEFVVRLPAMKAASRDAHADAHADVQAKAGGNMKVLVVDDNVDAAAMLLEVLSASGYAVQMAHDGPSALAAARRFQPDVAVLDIGLPVMDGYELGGRLRSLPGLEDVRLIALTGYGQEGDRAQSTQSGFSAHLVKPVDLAALRGLLERVDS
ncbi:MEDS domain-containing protein [Polyangium aurulentum]|uniref:hybrid sensor histidine kinase/response regulator n=1 Tax=Polyangium aurulentum TaxID=2567896 RepID=UPI00146F0DCB|nr:MEDS domain-containing protein [Polyangium aurulentum]UQA57833.1 MEDS domain-containing protein [Polyangium aurulentum]